MNCPICGIKTVAPLAHLLLCANRLAHACQAALEHLTPRHIKEYIASYPSPEEGWSRVADRVRVLGPDVFDPNHVIRTLLELRAATGAHRAPVVSGDDYEAALPAGSFDRESGVER